MTERKPQQRGNGEGSIRHRADGRWEVAVYDRAAGKRRSAYAKTEAEAKRLLRRMASRADTGDVVLDAGASVRAYSAAWLEGRAGKKRRASTVREYQYRIDKWIIPALGSMRLREVTVLDVEDLLDSLAGKGMKSESVRAVRNTLAAMMRDAVRAKHLSVNTASQAQLPERGESEPEHISIPTDAQVQALIKSVRGSDLEAVVALCAGTGARIGEVLGAQWADMDLEAGTWRVGRTITRDRNGAAIVGARTKTGRHREVGLTSDVVASLKGHRRRQAATRVKSAHWEEHDLVFPTSVGTPQDPHNVRRALKVHTAALGFPGSFHALRHWFASLAVTMAPDVTVAKVLGHARTSTTTDLYAHLRQSDAARIAVAVSVAVNGGDA